MVFSIKDGKLQIGGYDLNTDPMHEADRVKETPDIVRDEESLNNLNQNHGSPEEHLKALLDVPFEARDPTWEYSLFRVAPEVSFLVKGGFQGADERGYVVAIVNLGDREDALTFVQLIQHAFETERGIAFLSRENFDNAPDTMLRFGAVWSYREYGYLGGTSNAVAEYERAFSMRPENPFDAIEKDSDRITLGVPSEAYFPSYVREMIIAEIQQYFGESQPDFQILGQERYALPYSILISLGGDYSAEDRQALLNKLIWFMPPYLPIIFDS